MEEILLTPEEVADLLRVTPEDVLALVCDGGLAGLQVRGQWRITPESVKEFFSENLRAQNLRVLEKKLKDPGSWLKVLEEFPDVAARIEHENFEPDSFGAFLKKLLVEAKAMKNSSNVIPFRRPKDDEGKNS
jgi:excisionase family DNA binding protein